MRNLVAEFRQFILRGNVVDLAVGIVIGVAFTGVVQGLVRDFINPLIAALFGKPDFSKFHFTIHHAVFPTEISSTGCSQWSSSAPPCSS